MGLAVATCNRRFTLLRMVYKSAIRAGLLDRHPVVGLIVKENNARVRYLTDDEERRSRRGRGARTLAAAGCGPAHRLPASERLLGSAGPRT